MLDGLTITITRSERKTLAIQIERDGKVVVKAPKRASDKQIDTFLRTHEEWIERTLQKVQIHNGKKRDKDQYLFLGKEYTLLPGSYTQITIKGEHLLFPQGLLFRKEKELQSWYIRQAKEIITAQTERFAHEMKTEFKEITFSDTRSQWGRCTHDNRLQFSWRLVMAPLLVLNYVVVHELAHTMEHNHTQLFWMKVRNINPSYRQQIKWLKDHGSTLVI